VRQTQGLAKRLARILLAGCGRALDVGGLRSVPGVVTRAFQGSAASSLGARGQLAPVTFDRFYELLAASTPVGLELLGEPFVFRD